MGDKGDMDSLEEPKPKPSRTLKRKGDALALSVEDLATIPNGPKTNNVPNSKMTKNYIKK